MALTRQQIIDGTLDEWRQCAATIRGLSPEQWRAPTRCDGWEVRDVAGHLVGLVSDVFAGTGLEAAVENGLGALAKKGWSTTVDLDSVDRHQLMLVLTGRADPATVGLGDDANIYR